MERARAQWRVQAAGEEGTDLGQRVAAQAPTAERERVPLPESGSEVEPAGFDISKLFCYFISMSWLAFVIAGIDLLNYSGGIVAVDYLDKSFNNTKHWVRGFIQY